MRKLLVALSAITGLLTATAGSSMAITGNYVEDFQHPFVGLVVVYDESGEFLQRCSGSLLSPTVFLTAAHCFKDVDAASARVYFQQDPGANFDDVTQIDPVTGYPEYCAEGTLGVTCATSDEFHDFEYDDFAEFPDTRDLGVVILDQAITLPEYGVLAADRSLDSLDTGSDRVAVTLTASGYGVTEISPVGMTSLRERLMAHARLTNLRNALTDGYSVQINGNGKGRGGICFGDSGGPVFYGGYESNVIVAVNSFVGNEYCRGVGFSYRIDRAEVIAWILSHAGDEADDIQVVEL